MIVGLTGPARCGKNTIADHLVAKYGFTRFAFSDALYREVAEAFGVSEESLRNEANKDTPTGVLALEWSNDDQFILAVCRAFGWSIDGPEVGRWRSPREILQWWGTEYRRAQDPDYWVKKLDEALHKHFSSSAVFPLKVAVDGVRFPNEEAYLRGLVGFEMWHIHRPNGPAVAGHVSEVEQKRITVNVDTDIVLQNNGTVAQLLHVVDMVFDNSLGGDA